MSKPASAPIVPATEAALTAAAALLHAGELVAMPTETVYGLAADARNPAAVGRIFAAKGRPADHPLIVHLAAADQLDQWARDIPPAARALAAAFWPGPLTLILKRAAGVPAAVTGGQDTVGVRVPAHPAALALLRAFGGGLAAPSANRFGRISPTTAAHVAEELGERLALIIDGGPCAVGIESTIVDLSRGSVEVLRPGAISAAELARVIDAAAAIPVAATLPTGQSGQSAPAPRVSGALAAHYAPGTRLCLVAGTELAATITRHHAEHERLVVLAHQASDPELPGVSWLPMPASASAYARQLYARLRAADALGADLILIEAPPDAPAWRAIHDRLGRAAVGSGAQ